MSISVFTADMNTIKIDEFFTLSGLITPVKSKLHKNYQKLKLFVMNLSEIELRKNRIGLFSEARLMKFHSGDLMFEKIIQNSHVLVARLLHVGRDLQDLVSIVL